MLRSLKCHFDRIDGIGEIWGGMVVMYWWQVYNATGLIFVRCGLKFTRCGLKFTQCGLKFTRRRLRFAQGGLIFARSARKY